MPFRLTRTPARTWRTQHCCVCFATSASRDLWIDGGISVEGEGDYLICDHCGREIAGLLGMVSEDAAEELLCRALEAETKVDGLGTELAETHALLKALRRYDAAHAAPVADPGPGVSSSPSGPEDSIEERVAAVDAELAKGPVLEHACPGGPDAQACDRRFSSAAAAGAHAFRKHGRRTAQ